MQNVKKTFNGAFSILHFAFTSVALLISVALLWAKKSKNSTRQINSKL
jgi:hypothetical protein